MSNLGNLNVEFGVKIQAALAFIDSIELPELTFLARLSPLKDGEWDSQDSSAHQTLLRGSRGKIKNRNGDVFLGSGKNFIFSLLVLVLGVGIVPALACCLNKKSKTLRMASSIYKTLIGVLFYDYQMIVVTEIAMMDYSGLTKLPFRFWVSLTLSISTLVLILFESFWSLVIY